MASLQARKLVRFRRWQPFSVCGSWHAKNHDAEQIRRPISEFDQLNVVNDHLIAVVFRIVAAHDIGDMDMSSKIVGIITTNELGLLESI